MLIACRVAATIGALLGASGDEGVITVATITMRRITVNTKCTMANSAAASTGIHFFSQPCY